MDFTSNFAIASICAKEDPRTFKQIDFTPEAEDEVIRDSVSHKLDRPRLNPINKVWIESTKKKLQLHLYRLVTL